METKPASVTINKRRSLRGPRRRSTLVQKGFSNPRKSLPDVEVTTEDVEKMELELKELKDKVEMLEKDYDLDDLKEFMELLHEYNEVKDIGQMLLGRLAELKGTTTKAMYSEFDIDEDA